jgi:hypothetical protein
VGVDAVEVAVGVGVAVGVVARGLSYHRDAVVTRKIGGTSAGDGRFEVELADHNVGGICR